MLLLAWSICALPFPWHHGARVGEAAHPGPITSAVDAGVVLPPEEIWDPWDPRIDELINAPPFQGCGDWHGWWRASRAGSSGG